MYLVVKQVREGVFHLDAVGGEHLARGQRKHYAGYDRFAQARVELFYFRPLELFGEHVVGHARLEGCAVENVGERRADYHDERDY